MAIENIPVWPYEPNWSNQLNESLEWMTSILASPTGAEQRRCMRRVPRREVEYQATVGGSERAAMEHLIMYHGGRDMYLPMWQESYRLSAGIASGVSTIPVGAANNGGIAAGDVVFIGNTTNSLEYELVEIQSVSANSLTLVSALVNDWPIDAKVHPVRKARLTDQPTMKRMTDSAATATVSFMVMEQNDDSDLDATVSVFETYEGFSVLTTEPDWQQSSDRSFQRMMEEYDNRLSLPIYRDTANRSFSLQTFHWVNQGRAQYDAFRKLTYVLAGRFRSVWLPSFSADMILKADVANLSPIIRIANIGYTANGGVSSGRIDISITKADGTRQYRRIIASAETGDGDELLVLNSAFTGGLTKDSVLRISFMQLCRLNQDRLEIIHKTDTRGLSLCSATFIAAPNLRQVAAGF